MPTKLNKAGNQQEYVPAGNGDASGEYGNNTGSNKHFQSFKKPESKNAVKSFNGNNQQENNVSNKETAQDKTRKKHLEREEFDKLQDSVTVVGSDGKTYSYKEPFIDEWVKGIKEKWAAYETFKEGKGDNGGMTDERVAYDENEIKREIEKQKTEIGKPKYERKATFVFGLPAAGKSTLSNPIKKQKGAFEIDADIMKQHIPEFQNDPQMVSAVHEESSWMSKKMFKQLSGEGANLVIGKVGGEGNYKSIMNMVNVLKGKGYDIDIVVADVDLEKALQANLGRFINRYIKMKKGEKTLPPRIVDTDQHYETQDTYLDVAERMFNDGTVSNFQVYDMNDRKNPKLVKDGVGQLKEKTAKSFNDMNEKRMGTKEQRHTVIRGNNGLEYQPIEKYKDIDENAFISKKDRGWTIVDKATGYGVVGGKTRKQAMENYEKRKELYEKVRSGDHYNELKKRYEEFKKSTQ